MTTRELVSCQEVLGVYCVWALSLPGEAVSSWRRELRDEPKMSDKWAPRPRSLAAIVKVKVL